MPGTENYNLFGTWLTQRGPLETSLKPLNEDWMQRI